jgi:hypothetical protein
MRADALVAPIDQILADPHYFPANIDFERDSLSLIETSRARMAAAPFLDGRTPFARGIALEVPLSQGLHAKWKHPPWPDRFIFHVAFCGSTLLATLLDSPGTSFAEREPQTLVELADALETQPRPLVESTLELVRALLRRSWRPGEQTICKPSNWANSLIPLLTQEPAEIRPLFIATTKRDYLFALLRGGRERMAYVLRATEHLLRQREAGGQLWQRALQGAADPLEIAGRAAMLSLHVQLELFEEAMRRGRWGRPHLLTLAEIEDDPVEACRRASDALDLDIAAADLEVAVAQRAGRYAKDPSHDYSPERRKAENRQVETVHGPLIERVLDWAALTGLKEDGGINWQQADNRQRRLPVTLCA